MPDLEGNLFTSLLFVLSPAVAGFWKLSLFEMSKHNAGDCSGLLLFYWHDFVPPLGTGLSRGYLKGLRTTSCEP